MISTRNKWKKKATPSHSSQSNGATLVRTTLRFPPSGRPSASVHLFRCAHVEDGVQSSCTRGDAPRCNHEPIEQARSASVHLFRCAHVEDGVQSSCTRGDAPRGNHEPIEQARIGHEQGCNKGHREEQGVQAA